MYSVWNVLHNILLNYNGHPGKLHVIVKICIIQCFNFYLNLICRMYKRYYAIMFCYNCLINLIFAYYAVYLAGNFEFQHDEFSSFVKYYCHWYAWRVTLKHMKSFRAIWDQRLYSRVCVSLPLPWICSVYCNHMLYW